MTKMKPGLGRGLDALINPKTKQEVDAPITIDTTEIKKDDGESFDILAKVPTELIAPNPYQPRIEFDEEALEDLKKSILENGLIQPITIRRVEGGKYELISGERRLRAFNDIGKPEIPAYIIKVETKEAMVALALIENIQREQLNAIEVAEAYKKLMDECQLSQEEIANRVGKNRTTITNSIRLLKLPQDVQESLVKNEISAGHARALINLPNAKIQLELLNKIRSQSLSVRKVETIVKALLTPPKETSVSKNDNRDKAIYTIAQTDLENKLRSVFGTKVMCKQKKDGSGDITIEFYSNDELERLFELFEIINKYNN